MNVHKQIDDYLEQANRWIARGKFVTAVMSITHIIGMIIFSMIIFISAGYFMCGWYLIMGVVLFAYLQIFDMFYNYTYKQANKFIDAAGNLLLLVEQ